MRDFSIIGTMAREAINIDHEVTEKDIESLRCKPVIGWSGCSATPSRVPNYAGNPTPVVRNRLRYELGETPSARRKVRRIVSADPNPARRATAS